MSGRIRLAVAGACAVLAMLACMLYARQVRAEANRQRSESLARFGGEVAALAVATRTLEAGDVISVRDVEMRDWVTSLAPADALVSLEDVMGRAVTVPVAAGVPLTALNFRESSHMGEVPSGHVAVSVPVTDRLGVSPSIGAGSHVVAYQAAEDSVELIGEDVVVLSSPGTAAVAGRGSLEIAVLAQDVPQILRAGSAGDLRLVVPAADVRELGGRPAMPMEVGATGDGVASATAPEGGDVPAAVPEPQGEGGEQ